MDNYLPIRVSMLRGDQPIAFDAYVRVAGKYILYCREGDSFEGQRLERLRSKKLNRMYVRREQARLYDAYIKENLSRGFDAAKGGAIEERAEIIQGAVQATAEDLIEDVGNESLFSVAQEASARFHKFLQEDPKSLKALVEIKNTDNNIAHHGVNVSALALALAEKLGFAKDRPMQMPNLSTACFIHDLEHHYTPISLDKVVEDMPSNERAIYDRHTRNADKRIKDVGFYDQLTRDIILYHDEHINGSGTLGKKEDELDPLVFVAATANVFDHMITQGKLSPKEALKKMLIDKMGILPLDCMKALQEVLKSSGVV